MNRWELEVQKSLFRKESTAIAELEKQYKRALKDIGEKVKGFQADIDLLDEALNQDGLDDNTKALLLSRKRSKVYQQQYQEALKGQVSAIVDKLHGDNYATLDSYLKGCYTDGYIGTMYDIAKQGIPLVVPIDQAAAVQAVLTNSKISKGLYTALGVDAAKLKKQIVQEVSRGIASSLPYRDIARNISSVSGAPLNRAKVIARTEGHRIQQTSTVDAQKAAKEKGCDIVKQWDAALDKRTRPSHAKVDGEIRELDEPFSNGLMFPGDPAGGAAEVVNCRCASLTRAKWALDESELQTLKDRAAYFGLDKTANFEEYRNKYLVASQTTSAALKSNTISSASDFSDIDNFTQTHYNIKLDTSITALDFDAVKPCLEGFNSVVDEFPDVATLLQSITTSKSGVMACSGDELTFNPAWFDPNNKSKLSDACAKYSASGWWPKNTSPQSIGVHECAHGVEWVLIQNSPAYSYDFERIEAWNKCTEAGKIVSQACKNIKKTAYGKGKKNDELIRSISQYAADTKSEAMAEAFADVYANGANANPLSAEIKRLTEETLKSYKGGSTP